MKLLKEQLQSLDKRKKDLVGQLDDLQKKLQQLSESDDYSKYAYVTKEDLDQGLESEELMIVIKPPVGSILMHCGDEELQRKCNKYKAELKEQLDACDNSDPSLL